MGGAFASGDCGARAMGAVGHPAAPGSGAVGDSLGTVPPCELEPFAA